MPGFTSHVIGSRNLDMAAAGDFDGDGQVELLNPNQALDELAGIRHETNAAAVAWFVPIDGQMSTNLVAVTLTDNTLAVGLGRNDGVLKIWVA